MDLTADAGLHVAFFRNLNLGQPRSKSPGSAALVAAFTAAGASGVRNFQTNGTVLFRAADTGHVVVAVLSKLADAGEIEPKVVQSAIERFEIDSESRAPWVD